MPAPVQFLPRKPQVRESDSSNFFLWLCVLLLVLVFATGFGFWYTNRKPDAEEDESPKPRHLLQHTQFPALDQNLVNYIQAAQLHLQLMQQGNALANPQQIVGPEHLRKDASITDHVPRVFRRRDRIHYIFVNQQNYNSTTGKLLVPVNLKNVSGFELFEAAMPRGIYVINSANKNVILSSAEHGEESVDLTEGDYTATELQVHLNTVIGALNAGTSVSYSTTTQKFTFVGAVDVVLKFADTELAYMLGFGAVVQYPAAGAAGTSTVVSPYRCDLFGGRYLRFEAKNLRLSYANTDVVAQTALASDITFVRFESDHIRTFVEPVWLKTVSIDVKVVAPNNTTRIYDPNGLTFSMRFLVRTTIMVVDRSSDAVESDLVFR